MIDVSDGLLADLGHIAAASGVGDRRAPRRVRGARRRCATRRAALGVDPYTWILAGGDDHALAATFPPGVDAAARTGGVIGAVHRRRRGDGRRQAVHDGPPAGTTSGEPVARRRPWYRDVTIEIRPVARSTTPVAQRADRAPRWPTSAARYGGNGDDTPVDADRVRRRRTARSWSPTSDGEPVGCGGWRSHGDGRGGAQADVHRAGGAGPGRGPRGAGGAWRSRPAAHGRKRVILETGDQQPEAIALYEPCGYERIPDFGYYRTAGVLSFGRDLLTTLSREQPPGRRATRRLSRAARALRRGRPCRP